MSLDLALVTIDSTDPHRLANFWALVTGAQISESADGASLFLGEGKPGLAFQRVQDPTPGKNKFHLDLVASDIAAEEARLLELGAKKVAERGDERFRWVQFEDPEGNVFDIAVGG